ncbi:MAG TPA: anti-phage ZorAB system protein ZorA [Steroidobacteraceae bacterium]
MSKLLEYLQANPLVSILALVGAVLLAHFLLQYILRGLRIRARLIALVTGISSLGSRDPTTIKPRLDALFEDTRLARAWREYEESLHTQLAIVGEHTAPVIRATQPAEAFFNLDTVVDPWIGSEYFKHLPGILTGFGIIGTFFGLIQGLIHFDPSLTDSADLRRGLGELFGHVRDAFMFSGVAITSAILVTITEKWLYSSCAKWVLELATTLDGLFKTGVGEEYLSSLLKTSQDNATQSRQLKEAMVEDLRFLMTGLTERQVQATRQMAADLARSIRESLQAPLAEIARTVALASGRETQAMSNVLEQLMTAFLTQMRDTLGQQLNELGGLIQQTAQAVHKIEIAMHGLLQDVQTSGNDSATRTQAAVNDLLQRVAESQRLHGETLATATSGVLLQLNEALTRMATAQEEAARKTREGNDAAATQLRRQVASAADSHTVAMDATRGILDRFESVSAQLADRLAAASASVVGAVGSLQRATEQMSRVGLELATLEGQTQRSTHDMVRASSHLSAAAQTVGKTIQQLGSAAVRFEGVASSASVEANARRQLLISLQDVIDQSQAASREFVKLAQEARNALSTGVEQFGSDVSHVLTAHVRAYQKQLGDSVSSLRKALDQLAVQATQDRS